MFIWITENLKFQYRIHKKYMMLKEQRERYYLSWFRNTTDDDPVYCNFVIDLVSGDKVEIDLDDVKRYCSED